LGLPEDWTVTQQVIANTLPEFKNNLSGTCIFKKKCPEIKKLTDYEKKPPKEFWESFPEHTDLSFFKSRVDTVALKKLIDKCSHSWTIHQKKIAKNTLKNLMTGTSSKFKVPPKPKQNSNGKSSFFFGEQISDAVGYWIKRKFVLGPFFKPPYENMCCSPLMASKHRNKIRPILNLSAPKDESVNDCMKSHLFRKLTMSSAKKFGQSLLIAGRGATFAKTDLQDAYKLLPCSIDERKYFCFHWLDKFFIDISTPFGSKAAPANFDDLGETLVNIAATMSNTPPKWIHRQLDDVPVISPPKSGITEKFSKCYEEICEITNIPIADKCPMFEKAFGPSHHGIVLGVNFNSLSLEWKLPEHKLNETVNMIQNFLKKTSSSLIEAQKLHGKLNDFGQMHTFSKGFKFHQNAFLKKFEKEKVCQLSIPDLLKIEMRIWLKMILNSENGQKIPTNVSSTPYVTEKFMSDAAGPKITWTLNNGYNIDMSHDSGFASFGYNESGVFFSSVFTWPISILSNFPSNSAILECIGLLAPFVCDPKMMKGKNVLLQVDNTNCVFAWENRTTKNNEILAILIQILHIFEAAVPCRIFIEHVKRRSNYMAILADDYSRISTAKKRDNMELMESRQMKLDGPLVDWFLDPFPDWNLPYNVVDYAMKNK